MELILPYEPKKPQRWKKERGGRIVTPFGPSLISVCSGGAVSAQDLNPETILGALNLCWLRGDEFVESGGAGTGITQGTDKSGNNRNFTNAGGTARPTAVASVALANNQPGWTFNGTANRLDNTSFARPAPGTTPTWLWVVAVIESYTANDVLICGVGTNTMLLQQAPSGTLHRQGNPTGANSNAELTVFPAVALITYEFTNSTADFMQIRDTVAIGSNSGNNSTTGFRIGVNNGGTVFSNATLLEAIWTAGFPGATKFMQLNTYGVNRYGSVPFT